MVSAAATSIPVRNRVVIGCAHHSPYSVLSFLLPRGCTAFWYVELTQSCYLLKIPPHGHFVPEARWWNGGSNHSLCRFADTVARQTMALTGTSEQDIDLYFGWQERFYQQKMQIHYESRFTRTRRTAVTSMA